MEHSTVGSLLRTTQAWCAQLCEKQTLSRGIAFYAPTYASLPEANQFREVLTDDPSRYEADLDEADEWFRDNNLSVLRFAPAMGATNGDLDAFLARRGFRKRTFVAMALAAWKPIDPDPRVRVLPARAMRSALRATFHAADRDAMSEQADLSADATGERLDDPRFDMFVAMVDDRPAGRCALFQVGDIARVMDLHVHDNLTRFGVVRALTQHVLALAKRLVMRNICVQVEEGDAGLRDWFEAVGFVEDGTIAEFDRPPGGKASASP